MTNVLVGPENSAAERAVLAGLFQYGSECYINICEILNDNCFSNTENQLIFKCAKTVLEKSEKVDIPSIISIASQFSLSDMIQKDENIKYIRSLFNFPILKDNVKDNAVILRKLEIARNVQKVAKEIYAKAGKINGSEKVSDIVALLEDPAFDFGLNLSDEAEEKTEKIGLNIEQYIENWKNSDNTIQGIPSIINAFNIAIGGGRRRGSIYLTGARPKVGKSTLAINDAIFVALKLNLPVLYLDTEMTKDGQLPRIMANISKQDINDIETGVFAKNSFTETKVNEAGQLLKNIPLYYRRIAGKPFGEIMSIILRFIKENVGQENGRTKDCLIIYDYFKLMDSAELKELQEYQALGFQISKLSDFCGKYDVPVHAFVQLNREDSISQSDRLLWLCSSFSYMQRKTFDELALDGQENGNVKLYVTEDQRYGPGLEDGNYINLKIQKEKCIINEGLTKNELGRIKSGSRNDTGFDIVDDGVDREEYSDDSTDELFTDDDFNKANYRDDQYRR